MKSTTSSFRISHELRKQLDQTARRLKLGKNSLITQALEDYLQRLNGKRFLEEARSQSLLASKAPVEDEDLWLQHADTSGWK